ncbi:HNH endonuclease [Mesorhizobium sp. Cs1299R1N3]|uniref:HNH endonuclease n=1 Tax=Mesorhizobium sp. Cs1299R1N3 TaxID=3015173 RepID=UPI00301E289B
MARQQQKLDVAFLRAYRDDARASQESLCDYCRDKITARTATADHVEPKAAFGKDHRNNIVAACGHCNRTKGHMPAKLFRRMIEEPKSGEPLVFRCINARLRINRRLELMEKRIVKAISIAA